MSVVHGVPRDHRDVSTPWVPGPWGLWGNTRDQIHVGISLWSLGFLGTPGTSTTVVSLKSPRTTGLLTFLGSLG